MYNSLAKLLLLGFAFFISSVVFIQFYLYTSESSLESHRPLQIPITIVTAASGNHACALEAFLYHINTTLSQLNTSAKDDMRLSEMRMKKGQQYLETSLDMKEVRGKGNKKPMKANHSGEEGFQSTSDLGSNQDSYDQDHANGADKITYEIRPKVVVYNLGMGPTKQKKVQFKALIEAGYMDELYDFEFEKYPEFWKLDTETRGEYGWKAGIIEEISRRVLASPATKSTTFIKGRPGLKQQMTTKKKPTESEMEDAKIRDWAAIEEQVDEGPVSLEDEEALDELEKTFDALQRNYRVMPKDGSGEQSYEPGIVLWLDSGDRPSVGFLRWLPGFMFQHGLWTAQSQDNMYAWTHPGMLSYYHDSLDSFAKDETNCNAAAVAFDVRNTTVRNGIMKEWVQCSHTKECIAPEGSSRENHRQDQAALTYLVKTMGFREELCHGFPDVFGVKVNQDRYCREEIAANPNRIPYNNDVLQ
ncbi:hypothetical protein BGX27_009047 [Mortierella sp. AM989]|nr:hypothetical protein BGX27_009047 [Mortierella sp. AM989]